ncbi:winged helix-turn-helix domain-containing protein [Aliikangiella sp. IMCC44359]|uniref:winged helix-turn-helix domain-containing protein n=1 Tax=Aliikangiella sp. IMCC44359 TaxID=3459125 RepID=UPI00403B2A34
MSEQYWVGGFFIDLSRNQITQNKQSQTIAPKALAVLTYLAKHQGKVVSHDTLLDKVWQKTTVSPNTLQKSIAQLRKALGDSGNVYIKTHAKQGYSLECDVRWHHENDIEASSAQINENEIATSNIDHTAAKKPLKASLGIVSIIAFITILGGIGFNLTTPKQPTKLSIEKIRALTATDNKEFSGIYSPDGQYVVFHRYSAEFCINHIWAKNTKTQQEFQLTKHLGAYGSHSFSKDGKNLVFIQSGSCNQPINQKQCYKLMTLDFNRALNSPQSPRELMECKNSIIQSPQWLNNNNISLLQKYSDSWKLISYSINENKSKMIYTIDNGNIIDYDYSATDNLIALTSIRNDGHLYIEILKPEGQLISSHRINYPEEIAQFRFIYPNFSPLDEQLIFSTGKQLFALSYNGQVTNISLPLDGPMSSPIFHPNGQQMLVIKGHYDSDIIAVTLPETEQASTVQKLNYSVLERSIVGEDKAIFQPNGDLIAYKSERSGEEQIWLTDGKSSQQISHFPIDAYIVGMNWAADGQSILANAIHELTQVFLDGNEKSFSLDHPVESLFQWDSDNQTALVNMRIKGKLKFAKLDLTNSQIQLINNKIVNWTQKSETGQLIYTDHMDRFWKPGPAEDQLIEALDGQGSDKRFVIRNNVIFGVNKGFQLWSYALDDDKFEILGKLPDNLNYVTDVNQSQLLASVRISSKKEVVELIVKE